MMWFAVLVDAACSAFYQKDKLRGGGGARGGVTNTNLEVPRLLFRQGAGQQEDDQTLRVRHARKDTQRV